MTAQRPAVADILPLAAFWSRTDGDTYIASEEVVVGQYVRHTYTRGELASQYGKLVDVLDRLCPLAIWAEGTSAEAFGPHVHETWRLWENLKHRRTNTPMYYDGPGYPVYVGQIYEFHGYTPLGDALFVEHASLGLRTLSDGTWYVVDKFTSIPKLPVTWLEQYFPGATERLTLGVSLQMDDDSLVAFVCDHEAGRAVPAALLPADYSTEESMSCARPETTPTLEGQP